MTKESIELFFNEGTSDKIYKCSIEEQGSGFVVNFEYGRRGSALKAGTKTPSPVAFDEAKKVYDKLVNEKTGKGYQASSPAVASTFNYTKLTQAQIDVALDDNGESEDGLFAIETTVDDLAANGIGTSCGRVGNTCFTQVKKAGFGARKCRGWYDDGSRHDEKAVCGMFHIECSSDAEAEKIGNVAGVGHGSLRPEGPSLWKGFYVFEIE
jgi:predicted DNA-binding WGR domain protein